MPGAKQQNKRRRKMGNVGRKRIEGEPRYANGKIKDKARTERQEREARSLGLENRQKHLGVDEKLANDQDVIHQAWRWLQQGGIQEHHWAAARAFHTLHHDFQRAVKSPGLPRGNGGIDTDPDGVEPEYVDWTRNRIAQWTQTERALGAYLSVAMRVTIDNQGMYRDQPDYRMAMNIVGRVLL